MSMEIFSAPTALAGLVPAGLWATAGLVVYLFLLNRRLIWMQHPRLKLVVNLLVFLLLTCGSSAVGWQTGWSDWMVLPAFIFGLTLAGEVNRQVLRRIYRGSSPHQVDGPPPSIRRPLTTSDLGVEYYEVPVPGWLGELRVVHVTDFHVNDHQTPGYFEDVVARANSLGGDLIVLSGDFVSREDFVPRLPALLSPLHARLGVYAILGNHDYWAGGPAVADAVESAGITLLGDACCPVDDRDQRIWLCGYEEPWGIGGLQPPLIHASELRLVLTHTPDNIYTLSKLKFHAVFAGHNHGGQVRLPGLGAIVVPSRFGRLFDRGHFVVRGTHLFVSSGVGASNPPVRLYCPPDIFVVTFKPAPAAPATPPARSLPR